ncbi:Phosphoribosylglycinamide formyltransferase 2 [Achromobacter xylosoxidans]|nr:Phosphoribosylglycinamide formyltransferase 2 [Achromobacter xylosoxidans]
MSSIPSPVLGTPLSPLATRVMLLGSGELGKEVIIALQRLGVEVIAVDRYADAPGHQVAHRAHVVSMTDPEALEKVIRQEQPHVIVPEIEAIATNLLVQLESAGVARVTPTARAAQLTMNREGIRRLAAETLGLPTSPYAFVDTEDELRQAIDGGIGYPCVIKPVMSSSGKGQSLIKAPEEVASAWRYAQEGGRVGGGRAIVEGFIRFDYEITLLTVRARGADGQVETRRPGRDPLLRADRPQAGRRRLCRKLAAASHVAGRAGAGPRDRVGGHGGIGRAGHLRCRTFRGR